MEVEVAGMCVCCAAYLAGMCVCVALPIYVVSVLTVSDSDSQVCDSDAPA